MAIFGFGKVNKKSKPAVSKSVAVMAPDFAVTTASAGAIVRPHVTEKSGLLSQTGVYTFQVTREANRESISKAIKALYKVTPAKIALINLPDKNVFLRGRKGRIAGVRKALVTVKKGDKIDFV